MPPSHSLIGASLFRFLPRGYSKGGLGLAYSTPYGFGEKVNTKKSISTDDYLNKACTA